MKNMYFTAALFLLVLTGCSNERYEGPDLTGTKATVWANINGTQTRASETAWAADDRIGVTVGHGDPRGTNIQFKYSGTPGQAFIPTEGNELYVKSQVEVPATAYYPYTGEEGTEPGKIEINTSSTNQTAKNQPAIDYLFAQTTTSRTNSTIRFEFFHTMSKLIFNFQSEDPETSIENLSYTLNGVAIEGTFDTSTGIVTPENKTGAVGTPETQSTNSFLILIPQSQTDVELEVLVNNVYYTATISNLKLESGYAHTYNVMLKNLAELPYIIISEGIISPWLPGEGGNIEAPEHKPGNEPSVEVPGWESSEGGEIESQPK